MLETGESYPCKCEHMEDIEVNGELIFYTGMTGYEDALFDPQYKGKYLIFSNPLIGIRGIANSLKDVPPTVAGVIVYQIWNKSFPMDTFLPLKEYLSKWRIPLFIEVDTRSLIQSICQSNGTTFKFIVEEKVK